MKKMFLAMLMASLLLIPSLAQAQEGFQTGDGKAAKKTGGFAGPNASLTTVAEALKMNDEDKVTLVGRIEERLGHDKYRFTDGTGSIVADIDDRRWRGQEVTPEDTVELIGEIDRDLKGVEVDVKKITKQ